MAKLIDRLVGKGSAPIERAFDPYDLFLEYFTHNGNSFYGQVSQSYPAGGSEQINGGFYAYVDQAYKRNGVVFACVAARLYLFAEARFQYQRLESGRPGDLFGDRSLEILERPWAGGTTGELLARMEQDASLAGNAYIAKLANGSLRRLRPDWVSIVLGSDEADADIDNDLNLEVVGYSYLPPMAKKSTFLTVDQVAHYSPIPDPAAMFRGMSWLSPIVREIEADTAATKHKLEFFRNGATPNMIVKFDRDMHRDKVEAFKQMFESGQTGVSNAYKTLFLGGGADATVVGNSFEQMSFKATQGAGETRIAAAAGVPPVIVGLSEGLEAATYSNYAQARRRFADGTIRPLWRVAAATLEKLVNVPAGARLWYDDRDIPALAEDQRDAADIQNRRADTMGSLIRSGFEPDSVVAAVQSEDFSLLKHSGNIPVTLYPDGQEPGTI